MIIKGKQNSLLHQNTYNPYSVNQTDMDFITLINNKITGYGQIPYNVPKELIIDCIKTAGKLFFEWYPSALHNSYFVIDSCDLVNHTGLQEWFRKSIIVDKRIMIVRKIYETTNFNLKKSDFDIFRSFNTISGSHSQINTFGINNNMFMMESAVKMVELTALENMFKTTIPFDYNWHTNELFIKKSFNYATKLILDCSVCNNIETLYRNFLFEKYVVALTKRELKRILGAHTIQLPGGATLNVDEICNNLEDIENVEERLRTMNGVGDTILTR